MYLGISLFCITTTCLLHLTLANNFYYGFYDPPLDQSYVGGNFGMGMQSGRVSERNTVEFTKHRNWDLLAPNVCGNSMSDRIIGGRNASMGQYPWLAQLGYTSRSKPNEVGYKCGGTLIGPKYVVTAAHCLLGIPADLKLTDIRLGEHYTFSEIDCINGVCAQPVQDFYPSKILVHKLYNKPTKYQNDIALIRLDRAATLNGWVMPICLPHGNQLRFDYTGQFCEVAGWGVYDTDRLTTPSEYLLTVKLPIVDMSRCANAFRQHAKLSTSQLCIGGLLNKDSCAGDSGGPMMIPEAVNGPPKYYLHGIVSFGTKRCGVTSIPAIYTRVASFVFWILENLEP